MKYIFTLLVIVAAVSAVTVFYLWPEPEIITEDVLVIVNGHSLPRSVLEQKRKESGYHSKDDKALLDTIIINELLLQEAQRLKIDREPDFRHSVQSYYEQSLIKILIDRQFSEKGGEVTEKDVDRYISNYGKMFTFSRLSENKEKDGNQEEQKTVLFDDLSAPLQLMLGDMNIGDEEIYFQTGSEVFSLRLDNIEQGAMQEPFVGHRESIRRIIINHRREKALTSWIKGLRDQATITTPRKTETP